jgi:hypothetical protein
MASRKKRIDPNQGSFDFDATISAYRNLKDELLSHRAAPSGSIMESYEEACIEVAASAKRALRASGMSRDQLVDAINDYFGWPAETKKALSIHMLNHYLSKPVEYPIPAAMIFAIQHCTRSLDLSGAFAEAEGGRVITRDEIRELAIGKLDDSILEMQRLKRELRGSKQ